MLVCEMLLRNLSFDFAVLTETISTLMHTKSTHAHRDSVIGIVNRYVLNGPGIEYHSG